MTSIVLRGIGPHNRFGQRNAFLNGMAGTSPAMTTPDAPLQT
jgi:hypothetical protein